MLEGAQKLGWCPRDFWTATFHDFTSAIWALRAQAPLPAAPTADDLHELFSKHESD